MTIPEVDLSVGSGDVKYPATPAEEKDAILGIVEASAAQVKEGDKFFLVTFRWWKQWSDYVRQEAPTSDGSEPGPIYRSNASEEGPTAPQRPSSIDNTDLVIQLKQEDELELRETLRENHDYMLLPEQVWIAFQKWYGGGPPVARKVINTNSVQDDHLAVEVHPLRIRLTVTPNGSQLTVRVSKQDTVGELYQRARELLNLGSEQIRIWDYYGKIKHGLMNDPKQTLEDADIKMDHEVLLEVQVDGSWPDDSQKYPFENGSIGDELALVPVEPSRSSFSIAGGPTGSRNATRSSSPDQYHSNSLSSPYDDFEGGFGYYGGSGTKSGPEGLTGLQNLGNTCFMNSALQCLVHTPQLVDFFLQDYTDEINRQNPLGMQGELALAFGELLRKLWAPGRQPVAPRSFKAKLARFAPQFSGYNQHDSQELLAFLLDGLHEDLNRVKLKPYIESEDVDGRPDEEVAHENWENHKARNDSIIVDICQGQYKSTLVCPVCSKVSITFDPFMYLSLPLPSTITRTLTVKVFSTDGLAAPAPCTITIPKQSRCKDLILPLSKACNLQNDERLLFTEPYNLVEGLSLVRDDDHITAHKLPKASEKAPLLVFINRHMDEDTILKSSVKNFGSPLVAWVPEEGLRTGVDLLHVFENLLQPLRKSPFSSSLEQEENCGQLEANGSSNYLYEDKEMHENNPAAVDMVASLDTNSPDDMPHSCNGSKQIVPHLFQFWLVEERFLGKQVLIEWDKALPPVFSSSRSSTRIQIVVEWSEYALEQYDAKQLEVVSEVSRTGYLVKKPRQEAVSLYSCLEAFLREEPLGPEDMWYCPRCKEHRQASKKLDLWRLPDILVVHLKRFSYSRYLKNKLETFVNFPIHDLDLTKYIPRKDGAIYELYAISNHYGSMGGGHYTAYVKLLDDNKWYNFDDSHVSSVGENEIKTAAAYVLFYRRVRRENGNGSLSNGLVSHD